MATRRPKPRKSVRKTSASKASPRRAKPRAAAESRPGRAKPRKAATGGAAKAPARRAAPRAASASPLLSLARKIVRATVEPQRFDLRDLYAEGAVSREATGDVSTGHAELEAKSARWDAMQERSEWNPRRIFADGDAICIEWDATVWTRDGRVIPFVEVAVHEVRDGKIVAERFYYNPRIFAAQAD